MANTMEMSPDPKLSSVQRQLGEPGPAGGEAAILAHSARRASVMVPAVDGVHELESR